MNVLTLGCLHVSGIEVDGFQSSECQFSWSCIIAVRSGEDDRQLLSLEVLEDAFRLMIACVVKLEHMVPPPTWPLLIQLYHQLLEEENQGV